tara:strand:- start:310 stop:1110 length:801 start_codon:yes stop_codon:yes gene_type:complete
MRNKKIKNNYLKKRQLLTSYDFYKAKHKKLPVSKDEYQTLKDDILILENLYPSIKKMGDDLIIRATLNYPDGRTYKGAIKSAEQQIPHGHGYMYLSATDINFESKTFGKKLTDNPWDYVGEFKNGVFDGQGEYKCEGNYSYKGEWKKSHFHGRGKYVDEKTKEVYEGDFVESKRNGYGVFIMENEFKLEGQFKENDAHGKGKITILKDSENEEKGTTITGTFKKGLQQGMFKKVYPDGDTMDCMYVDNVCTKAKFKGDKKWTIYKK